MKRLVVIFALFLLGFPLVARAQSTLSVTTTSLPAASVGVPYNGQGFQLIATGGVPTYTWTYTGTLPQGLTLSPGGLISGTPTAVGTFNITFQVTDSSGSGGGGGGGTITCVQGCTTPVLRNWNGGPDSVSLASNITPGDAVVVMVEGTVAGTSFTINPSSGTDTYTRLITGQTSDTFQNGTIFYTCNSSGGYETVNGTWPGPNYGTVALLEMSGPASFCVDGAGVANSGTGTSLSVGPLTPSVANDFYFAILFNPNSKAITSAWTGATVLGNAQYTNGIFLFLNGTSTTPQTASGTMSSSSNWGAVIGAVKP